MVHEEDLRCPATARPLKREGDVLTSDDGARTYPVVDGVPILIDEERSLFSLADFETRPATGSDRTDAPTSLTGRAGRTLASLLPSDSVNAGTAPLLARFLELLRMRGAARRPRVLVVGGGTAGVGLDPLLGGSEFELTETDVWFGPRTELVCDGHDLPFRDGVFDAVLCQAVLEHVLDPQRVVDEMHRVLAPDGLLYSENPFIQQVHEGAFDFTRWTYVGQRRLFRRFDEMASGVVCGPGMALAWSVRYLAVSLGSSPWWRRVIAYVLPLLTGWLPRLDRRLIDKPGAMDAASSIGFVGRRRQNALSDEAIVASYRGINTAPARRS